MKKIIIALSLVFGIFAFAAKEVVILDVRTDEEFAESHLKGARQINFQSSDFKDQVTKLDHSKLYKIYCRSGNRAGKAILLMKEMGFTDLENLGGLKDASKKLGVACEGKTPC